MFQGKYSGQELNIEIKFYETLVKKDEFLVDISRPSSLSESIHLQKRSQPAR